MAAHTAPVALFSIHPAYAEAILAGDKTVEFRKQGLRDGVERVVIYATSPVQRLVGEVRIAEVDMATPAELWERHSPQGAIGAGPFSDYYGQRTVGAAILLHSPYRYPEPLPLTALPSVERPPQSFMYLEASAVAHLPAKSTSGRIAQLLTAPIRALLSAGVRLLRPAECPAVGFADLDQL